MTSQESQISRTNAPPGLCHLLRKVDKQGVPRTLPDWLLVLRSPSPTSGPSHSLPIACHPQQVTPGGHSPDLE